MARFSLFGVMLCFFQLSLAGQSFGAKEQPRTILALYKGSEASQGLYYHPLHRCLEMPLNHLGLKVVYWDILKGVPDLAQYPPLRGIMSWFYSEEMPEAEAYLAWAADQVRSGKFFLVFESLGAYKTMDKKPIQRSYVDDFLALLGIYHKNRWVVLDPTAKLIIADDRYVYFEETGVDNPGGIPAYQMVASGTEPFISVDMLGEEIPVVTLGNQGGVIIPSYFLKIDEKKNFARWIINPFYFFERAFQTEKLPKPDVTTHNGRRIYFSHIDGDGWRSISHIGQYAKKKVMCADVIRMRAIEAFPELPITVAPIAADLDPKWYGSQEAQRIAFDLFKLPQVQIASHTYSHPFAWDYYDRKDAQSREMREFGTDGVQRVKDIKGMKGYTRPRAYLKQPFDLNHELSGSLNYIHKFAPQGKKGNLIQWSGNCEPFVKALAVLRSQKIHNMNGGDSRFDDQFPSYSAVCPVGLVKDRYVQIYAVNSNENTYTDGWTETYYAFKYLQETFKRTESPIRVKGMNLYYHMYSAEREASLSSLLDNLNYIRSQNIIPLEAEHYVQIAEGFFNTRIIQESEHLWRVDKRGALNTVRFDKAPDMWIDFAKSKGVLGGRHYQGSLYVALDPSVARPLLAFQKGDVFFAPPRALQPYLHNSRWKISMLTREENQFSFMAQGYGSADMTWILPEKGRYQVLVRQGADQTLYHYDVAADGRLYLALDIKGYEPVSFTIVRVG